MRSTFGSFNIATSGLFASQRSLDAASHNIANANTVGYSRQKVLQRATLPISTSNGMMGNGVESFDIVRMRSEYLDYKYWGQNKTYNEWKVKGDSLSELEGVFNEPSDSGIRKVMDEFFSSLEELSKKTGDVSYRTNVVEKAVTFANSINRNGNEIVNSIRDINFTVKSKVEEVNTLAKQIADLNKQIFNLELGNHKANDMRDQRNVLIDKLSNIVNINVSEYKLNANEDENYIGQKVMQISVGGITLVNHTDYNKMTTKSVDMEPYTSMSGDQVDTVIWESFNNQAVNIQSGELKGYIDMRDSDGSGNTYRGLPYYLKKLNEFTNDFAKAFNQQHAYYDYPANTSPTYDFNGDSSLNPDGTIKTYFFDETATDCLKFKVKANIVADPRLICAASTANGESDNTNINKLISLRQSQAIFTSAKGTPDDFVKSLLSALAVDTGQAERMTDNYQAMVEQTKTSRLSESQVSLDEEMSDTVKLSQAYNASARMVTTIDAILDTTINRLGLVGR